MPISITLPTVGADNNVWGTELNTALTTLANAFDGTFAFIVESSGTYANRSTVTNSSTRPVIYIGVGASAPTIGGAGAINGVDFWFKLA